MVFGSGGGGLGPTILPAALHESCPKFAMLTLKVHCESLNSN